MNVNDFDKYISSYLEGSLSTSEVETFEKIVKDNPNCKEKLEFHKALVKELSSITNVVEVPDDFQDKLYSKIDEISPGFSNRVSNYSSESSLKVGNITNSLFNYNYPILRIAAGLAIFIFSVSIFWDSGNTSNSNYLSASAESEPMNDVAVNDSLDIDPENLDNSFQGTLKRTGADSNY